MREPQRWLSSPDVPPELKVVLGRIERPQLPSPAQADRLVDHISMLATGAAAKTVLTAGLLVKATAAVATVALTGWVVYSLTAHPPRTAPRPAAGAAVPPLPAPAPAAEPGPIPAPAAVTPVPAAVTPPPAAVTPAPVAIPAVTAETARPRRPARTVPAAEPVPSALLEQDPLAREAKLLEEARSDVQPRPAAALATLERHRREFRDGQLAAEREFLRVLVLKRLGRTADAEDAARQLRASFPGTVYAARVATVLGSPGAP